MVAHPIVHVELSANNPQEASEFYNALFDWKIDSDPTYNYWQFQPESGPGGGFVEPDNANQGGDWQAGRVRIYVQCDDIDSTLARIQELGGSTIIPRNDLPGVGAFAVFADPTGNQIGLYTPAQMAS